MDNITHSMAGALLGQMGLKKLTGLAMPTLIIAANLPDIDAISILAMGEHEHLAVRRGITHGPIAMVVLPIALTALMLLWNRFRPSKQAVKPFWLLVVAFIGCLSHPALDWLNSYGIRLFEPFSSRWLAADTLFIVDPFLWAFMLFGLYFSRRSDKRGGRRFWVPAWIGFALSSAYIAGNGFITRMAEQQGRELVGKQYRLEPGRVVATPVPVKFWHREIHWRGGGLWGTGKYEFPDGTLLTGEPQYVDLNDPRLRAVRERDDVAAFLFWSRMPIVVERNGRTVLTDQRFNDPLVADSFSIDLGPAE